MRHESYGIRHMSGRIKVYREDTLEVLFCDNNVICNTVKSLFARFCASISPTGSIASGSPNKLGVETLYGIWGLALGSGDPSWSADTQPAPTATQTALISQILRKPLSAVNYVDTSNNPQIVFTNQVNFQTTVNATTDNLNQQGIREMGLIGGGSATANSGSGSNMLTAPYWNPSLAGGPIADSVTLINYYTLPPLILPPGVNIIFSWVLSY